MTYAQMAKPYVARQPVYQPGQPVERVAREFGRDPATILKLASNENPLGSSPRAVEAMRRAAGNVRLYPEGGSLFLREALAERHGLDPEQFIVGSGSNEILNLLTAVLAGPGDEIVMGQCAFIAYKLAALLYGAIPVEVPLQDWAHDLPAMASAISERTRIVFLPGINNPTGGANAPAEIEAFARDLPEHVLLCFDEAYAEYQEQRADLEPLLADGRKIFLTRTFSKVFGLAGARIGYGYGDPELVALLNRVRMPFNVNSVAQAGALAALQDDAWVARSVADNRAGLVRLTAGLRDLGIETVPSTGNFLLARFEAADVVNHSLLNEGIIVRPVAGYGLPHHLRLSVGTAEQNERLLDALARIRDRPEHRKPTSSR